VKFRNDLEKVVYEIAKSVCAEAHVEHNRVIEIETAETDEVASFSGPPKKEIDVITAMFSERVQMLISCKKYRTRSEPTDVQEWGAVVQTMNRYSGGTKFVGLIISPSGFTAGCEAWATSHNLGLIPPLKGKDFRFPQSSAVQMSRRVIGAFAKRLNFPHEALFVAPGFYDFVFGLTADFEGRDEAAAGRHGGRYSTLETGWMSSFGELVSTTRNAEIQDVVATNECLGLVLSTGLLFLYFGDRIVFGNCTGFAVPGSRIEPECRKNLDNAPYSFAELRRLVIDQKLTSAADFGTHFEFGLSNDVNLGFYPRMLYAVRTLNPPEEHLL
jgi:hypothetical protein